MRKKLDLMMLRDRSNVATSVILKLEFFPCVRFHLNCVQFTRKKIVIQLRNSCYIIHAQSSSDSHRKPSNLFTLAINLHNGTLVLVPGHTVNFAQFKSVRLFNRTNRCFFVILVLNFFHFIMTPAHSSTPPGNFFFDPDFH